MSNATRPLVRCCTCAHWPGRVFWCPVARALSRSATAWRRCDHHEPAVQRALERVHGWLQALGFGDYAELHIIDDKLACRLTRACPDALRLDVYRACGIRIAEHAAPLRARSSSRASSTPRADGGRSGMPEQPPWAYDGPSLAG